MLHIIYGSDQLGRREAFAKLRAELDKDGSLATNFVTFEAKSASPQEVMAACDAMPFMGEHRLVVVEGARKPARRGATPPSADESEEDEEPDENAGKWATLAEYVPRMPPTTELVLLDDDVSSANALLKALGPSAKVTHCTLPDEKKGLPAW